MHANVVVKPMARSLASHGSLQHTSFLILRAVAHAFLRQPELEARDPTPSHHRLLLAVVPSQLAQASYSPWHCAARPQAGTGLKSPDTQLQTQPWDGMAC